MLVAERGTFLQRRRTRGDPSDPLTTSNVLVATEGPHQVLDALGQPVNPARKPWTVVADFLFQFGDGGLIFSMMDGLSAVTQAAISLGNYDVVAFEKDSVCWTYAQDVISTFLMQQEKQEKHMESKMKASFEVCFMLDCIRHSFSFKVFSLKHAKKAKKNYQRKR